VELERIDIRSATPSLMMIIHTTLVSEVDTRGGPLEGI
jgi:hypothetical protein